MDEQSHSQPQLPAKALRQAIGLGLAGAAVAFVAFFAWSQRETLIVVGVCALIGAMLLGRRRRLGLFAGGLIGLLAALGISFDNGFALPVGDALVGALALLICGAFGLYYMAFGWRDRGGGR